MPDHDSTTLLTRQTKRRRVDIGVKRTVGSTIFTRARETLFDSMNQSHGPDQDGDCSLVSHGHGGTTSDGEKSNVLRKLLKRANSYEDTIMPFPGATIISQLLKNNIGKNGGSDSGFQGSGALSSGGSEIQAEDACSNSSRDQDSPSDCLSPGPPLPPPSSSSSFGRPPPPSSLNSHAPSQPLSLSSFDLDRLSDEHLRAKRARVENIIRGMSHSPLVRPNASDHNHESNRENDNSSNDHRGDGNSHKTSNHNHIRSDCPSSLLSSPGSRAGVVSVGEVYRENKRKQRLPQQQHSFTQLVCSRQEQRQEERRQLKLQLEDMQKQLRQLQEKFYQIYDSETEEEEENGESGEGDRGGEREEDGNLSEDSIRSDGLEERHRDRGRHSHDELSELDPGLFLDRARALLREQALLDGEIEEDVDGREEEERNGERRMKRRGGGRQLAETLKQELNCAVSQVVDTVVKGFSSPKQAVSHGCHSNTPVAPSSSSNSSSSCPPPFGPLPSLTPDSRFGSGALALTLNGDGSPTPNYHSSNQRLHCFSDVIVPSPLDSFGGLSGRLSGVPTPNDQTEALPLVVRKSGGGGGGENINPSLPPPPPPHHPSLHPSPLTASLGFSPPSFRHPFPLPLMGYPFQSPLGSHGGGAGYPPGPKDPHRSSPDSMDMTRETVSLRTKMATLGGGHLSHHHRQSSPSQHGPEGLSLSLIKSECGDLQDIADISPYSGSTIQEGLSPNHLKKAKLMFFYTRYPSSNMLKMYFSDVKFNRCITSQLIKWFSNFREFYYIQMEKFARQAINEGVTAAEELTVGRDAELFRALNMHYNKANDFEVPDRFLEVAQVTLREFFNAIVAGKDADPSWKKAIYKVICKLDSEVPDVFKSPNCLQELLHD
ncbi:prospero homeobox protein 1-like [Xiphias gladius]|uniref:prospero homeobox protein 1-like n=1 Tax=Xiphias gladius TaxID=8245 RepID=UPI001A99B913|nr:prospero homeobox protein 1-like [Xiphias gladius]XP_039998378.1 prospero homeobox protein 1-like [Xiphias gladius]XP_039998379.1 prospero homeobox protein 1-like [Xiphias gladius]